MNEFKCCACGICESDCEYHRKTVLREFDEIAEALKGPPPPTIGPNGYIFRAADPGWLPVIGQEDLADIQTELNEIVEKVQANHEKLKGVWATDGFSPPDKDGNNAYYFTATVTF